MNTPNSSQALISDLAAGKEILSRIPLTNPPQALNETIRFLDSLLVSHLSIDSVFQLLEHACLPVVSIAEETAKRYLNKPVPLSNIEEEFFQQVSQLWQKMAKAYAYCAEENPSNLDDRQLAILLHRCIHFTGISILECQNALREVPRGLWLRLHGYYDTAEEQDLTTLAIPNAFEPQSRTKTTHCSAAYTAFLLCDMANGYSLSALERAMVRRLAMAWSALTSLHPFSPGELLPRFVVDLMHDAALRPATESLNTDQLRRFNVSHLAEQLSQVRQKLKQRIPPSQLGLGDDCTVLQCSSLIDHLIRQWSQGRAARKYRRRLSSGTARICTGFEDMHYCVLGEVFRQPGNTSIYSRQDFDRLFSFRSQETPQNSAHFNLEKFSTTHKTDVWEVVNESANGFRLVRNSSGQKMIHRQLLALCPHDGGRFLLAQVVWLTQEYKSGGLIAGIMALPGLPTAISVRRGENLGELYQRAFLLTAPEGTDAESSLILAPGWYRLGQIIEIFDKKARTVRLKGVLGSGPGFDWVRFDSC